MADDEQADRPDFADTWSRRRWLRFSAAASASLMLASGCKDVGSRGTTIRFWNGFTGPDGTRMLGIIKHFNATHDDVQVTMQRIVWDTYYNKVFVAGLGGRSPEVFVVQVDHLERFIWGGLVSPVDSIINSHGGLDPSEWEESILNSARRGNTTYAVPLDIYILGTYYNRRLFADAGIAAPPTDRNEFLDAMRRLTKGEGTTRQWGFVYEWLRVNMYALVRQWGGDIIGPDLRTCVLDSPQTIEAVKFAREIIADGLASPVQNTSAVVGFRQGRVGMVWCGTFILSEFEKQTDLDWAPAVLPQVGPMQATWSGSHMLCLKPGLNERDRTAAETFVRFLSDNSLDWALAGQVPARRRLRDTDRFRAMRVQSTFAKQIPYAKPMPSTTFTREYQIAFDAATEAVLRGDASPEVAMGAAATQIREAAARFAPKTPPATAPAGGVA